MESEESYDRELRALKDRYSELRHAPPGSLTPVEIQAELRRVDERIQTLEATIDAVRSRERPASVTPPSSSPTQPAQQAEPQPAREHEQRADPVRKESNGFKEMKRDVGAIVAATLVGITFGQGLTDGFIAWLQNSSLEAGTEEYIEFGTLYLSTFLLSVTLTGVVAIWRIPPLYGINVHWGWPILVLVCGALLTGLPVQSAGGGMVGWGLAALQTFATAYGTSFWGGLVVGAAGGLILETVVDHTRTGRP